MKIDNNLINLIIIIWHIFLIFISYATSGWRLYHKLTFDTLDIDYSKVNETYYLKIISNSSYVSEQTYRMISMSG